MAKKKSGARARRNTTSLASDVRASLPAPCSAPALLPLGALMLAASVGSWAQTAAPATPAESRSLAPVTVRERAEAPQGKDSIRATTTTIGKGNQELRDIPQSITVVTEKLIDDRNLDT
jgi:catecholate siderophore receptor